MSYVSEQENKLYLPNGASVISREDQAAREQAKEIVVNVLKSFVSICRDKKW